MIILKSYDRKLTTYLELWDPTSKQPMLESGAVKAQKYRDSVNEAGSEVKEKQSLSIQHAELSKPNAKTPKDTLPRRRFFDHWMTVTLEAFDVLVEICDRLIPALIQDLEVNYGIKIMRRISYHIRSMSQPYTPRAGAKVETSRIGISRTLCDLFSGNAVKYGIKPMKLWWLCRDFKCI